MLGTAVFIYPVVATELGFLTCILIFLFLGINYILVFHLFNLTLAKTNDNSLTYAEFVSKIIGSRWDWLTYGSFFFYSILLGSVEHLFRKDFFN